MIDGYKSTLNINFVNQSRGWSVLVTKEGVHGDERHMTDTDDFAIIKCEKGSRLYRLA